MVALSLSYFMFMALLFSLVFYLKRAGGLVFFLAFFWFAAKIPFYFLGEAFLPDGIDPNIFTEENYTWLVVVKSLFLWSAFLPFVLFSKRGRAEGLDTFISGKFILFIFVVYFAFLALYFSSVGGLYYLWENMFQRGDIIRGSAFYITFLWSISIFLVFSFVRYPVVVQLILTLILVGSIYLAYGSRSFSLGLVVFWFVCYFLFFGKLPFSILSVRSLLISFALLFFVIITPSLREGGVGLDDLWGIVIKNWAEIFQRLAVPQVEFLVIDYFSSDSYWFGRSWADLFYAFCPINYCQNKPPMDDGVYLYNIYLFGSVQVGQGVDQLVASSYPFETWSIFYANFGFIGVVVGGGLFGLFLACLNRMYYAGSCFLRAVAIASMGCVALNFVHFSNVYFFLFFLPVLIFSFLYYVSRFSSRLKFL